MGKGDCMIYQKAIDTFGEENQINKTIEECAELILALSHHKLNRCFDNDVIEEMADVEIMLEQMKLIFCNSDDKIYNSIKARKLNRLNRTINSYLNHYSD